MANGALGNHGPLVQNHARVDLRVVTGIASNPGMAEISAKAPAMKQGLAILGSSAIANTPLGVLGSAVLAAVAGVIKTDIEVMVILLASPTMTAQGKLSAVTGPIAVDDTVAFWA